ncbi:biotin/lipoyl-binding protein [Clostridium transplantifaecale]|uniref:biotin/lipoyl-binding protein n=1 Tax=Clostridium transplantifaecale TaxID=2479838 RepID=UPI000F62E4B0|nr:biotin/lipoyl-binding protein [Clostridium transplantifaecale]
MGRIYLNIALTGTVEREDAVYIYPEAAGTVTDVFVKAGDSVTQGQEILTILKQKVWYTFM